jgi:cytochrome c
MKQALILALALAAATALPAQANADLAKSKNCLACHTTDKKLVGPSFKEIASKYAGEKSADSKLATKIVKGGAGTWGSMAMPPNAVSEQEALSLARWVLAQK